jgi:hypothetical protein
MGTDLKDSADVPAIGTRDGRSPCAACAMWVPCPSACGWGWCQAQGAHRKCGAPFTCRLFVDRWK